MWCGEFLDIAAQEPRKYINFRKSLSPLLVTCALAHNTQKEVIYLIRQLNSVKLGRVVPKQNPIYNINTNNCVGGCGVI